MTRIIWNQITASGRRSSWAKPFDRVDVYIKGARAFCYAANAGYLQDGVETDLPEGTLILEVRPVGSVKNGHGEARIYKVTSGGYTSHSRDYDWHKEYLSLVDAATALLQDAPIAGESNPLAEYTTEQLLAELERRGMARA